MGAGQSEYKACDLPTFYKIVKIGDILGFPAQSGGPYFHYGIYIGQYEGVGRHCVVHFTVPEAEINKTVIQDGLTISMPIYKGIASRTLTPSAVVGASHRSHTAIKRSTDTPVQMDDIAALLKEYAYVSICNDLDSRRKPRDSNQICEKAINYFHNPNEFQGYNLYTNNCEHFVNNIRYGESRSQQVDGWLGVGVLGAIVAGAYAYFRGSS